jgi:hypothetical protein
MSHPDVILAGSGYGECIIIRLNKSEWGVIDSFINKDTGNPAAIDILEKHGFSPTSIKLIVLTHWHADHIGGASALMQASSDATLCISDIFLEEQILQLAEIAKRSLIHDHSGTEFGQIMNMIIAERKRVIWASPNTRVFSNGSEVYTLSPSNRFKTEYIQNFTTNYQLEEGTDKRNFIDNLPNLISIATLFIKGGESFLSGADLEKRGWLEILDDPNRIRKLSSIYKIAHHGSSKSDHTRIWRQLLNNNVLAILTPFYRLRDPIPKPNDLRRISSRAKEVFISNNPNSKRGNRRSNAVERTMREVTKARRIIGGHFGYIEITFSPSRRFKVELFGDAEQVTNRVAHPLS